MDKYNMVLPRITYSGVDALENLRQVVAGCKKAAIFTDKGILGAGLVDLPQEIVRSAGVETVILSDIPAEPSYGAVQTLVDEFRTLGADIIIAVGGGSAMDTAKLASILVTDEYTVKDLLDDPLRGKKTVTTCFIPTTAGTGSCRCRPKLRRGCCVLGSRPRGAAVHSTLAWASRMIKNLPRKIAAASGVDAMAHAIECFTSNKANPFSDTFALDAFDRILNNIERACDDPEALDAKREMQIAAFYGGIAITCSGTTAVHALSYPLGGKYHIAHGVSNAILLMPVMRFNEPAIRHKLALAYDRTVHGEKTCVTDEEKSAWIIERMGEIVKHLDIPTNLSQWNVSRDDLEPLVEAGMSVQRLLVNNMRTVTPEDARNIYLQIL